MKISPDALAFLQNDSLLRTKHQLIQELYTFLTHAYPRWLQAPHLYHWLTDGVFAIPPSGKVSRGENYLGLPYLIADAPRFFTKEDVFAYRTMFWWGHDFSCTLHLEGQPLERFRERVASQTSTWDALQTWICVHDTPWEYHFEPTNYQLWGALSAAQREQHLFQKDFLKLSRRLPIAQWEQLPDFGFDTLQAWLA